MLTCNHIRASVGTPGPFVIAGPNPNRVGLILNSPSTGTSFISLGEAPGTENCHFRIAAGIMMPTMILFNEDCDWIKQEIQVANTAGQTINLVEIMRPIP